MSKDEKKAAIFFGRKTCPDCVEAIHKIDAARKKNKKRGYKFYYFDTEMKLFKANKRFLERENKIDEIPAILVFNNKKTKILYDMNKIEVDDFF